jgi:hypothetical protein
LPDRTPEIFAPGIVSAPYDESKIVFAPGGRADIYRVDASIIENLRQQERWAP